jgi:hypothetical protein
VVIGRLAFNLRLIGIGRQPGEFRFTAGFLDDFQAKVIFVVADSHSVVMQRIHRQHHRVGRRVVAPVVQVFERRTLNRVARIDQQQIRIVLPRFFDQRGDFRDPHVVVFVRVVIDRKDAPVHVGRAEKNQVNTFRGGPYPKRALNRKNTQQDEYKSGDEKASSIFHLIIDGGGSR